MLSRREGQGAARSRSAGIAAALPALSSRSAAAAPQNNRFHHKFAQLDALIGGEGGEGEMATVVWRLRRAPWNTGSITHIHPASPARVHLLKNWEKKYKKKGRTHALSLSGAQLCVSRTAQISEAPRFRSPSHCGTLRGGVLLLPPPSLRLSERLEAPQISAGKKKEREMCRPQLVRNLSFTPRDPSHTDPSPPPQDGQRRCNSHSDAPRSAEGVGWGGFSCCCCPRC